jgi:hypothetical protein
MSDHGLREKYNLTAVSYVRLIQVLLEREVITEKDLEQRREAAVQKDLERQSKFISGLFLCPACSHPSPTKFDVCPACEERVDDYTHEDDMSTTLIDRQVGAYEDSESDVEMVEDGDDEEKDISKDSEDARLNSLRSFLSEKIKKKK